MQQGARRYGAPRDRGPRDAGQPLQDRGAVPRGRAARPEGRRTATPRGSACSSELAQLGSNNPHKLDLVRDGPGDGVALGPRRRPGLAGLGEPGDPDRAPSTRRPVARPLPASGGPTTRRSGAAGSTWRWTADARRARRGPAPPAGRPVGPGRGARAPRLVRRRRRATPGAERRALRQLARASPRHLPALERLAELELVAGAGRRRRPASAPARRSWTGPRRQYEILLFAARCRLAGGRSSPTSPRPSTAGWRPGILWALAAAHAPATASRPRPWPGSAGRRRRPAPDAEPCRPRSRLAERSTAAGAADLGAVADRGPRRPSATTPRPPGSVRLRQRRSTRSASSPRRWAAGSACSTTTATAGSTSTASRGGRSPPTGDRPTASGDRLFRNRGDGTFEDVTARSGHRRDARGGYGHGVAVGRLSTTTATPTCSSPDGGPTPSTATGATARSRTSPSGRPGGRPRLADLGGVRRPRRRRRPRPLRLPLPRLGRRAPARSATIPRTTPVASTAARPSSPSRPDHVFRNDGGRFVDVTTEAGIVDRDGPGLGVVAADLDGDGRVDLFVANDTTANYPLPQPGRPPIRGGRRASRRGRQRRRRHYQAAWGSPAATSTATAGPTWP